MSMGGDCRRGLMSPVVIDFGGDFSGVIVSGVNVPGVNVVEPTVQFKQIPNLLIYECLK